MPHSVGTQSIGEVVHYYYQIVYCCLVSFRVKVRVVVKANEHLKISMEHMELLYWCIAPAYDHNVLVAVSCDKLHGLPQYGCTVHI